MSGELNETILGRTKSLCPICLKEIDAEILIKNRKVVISKKCKIHGKFECPHAWDDPFIYKKMRMLLKKWTNTKIKDTTIDVTYKCNMICPFCFNTAKEEPNLDYILKRAKEWGTGNILLYGGEPTLRKDLTRIIRKLKDIGFRVILLTNGLNLDKKLAKELDDSGLDGILLQLDSLDDDTNKKMRGMKLLKKKIRAVESLEGTNIWLSFFVVIVKGINEIQIKEILSFAISHSDRIRVIIFTPLSPEGKTGFERKYLMNDEIFENIEKMGITKKDFIVCTEFDILLTGFLYRIGINRKSISLCEALCYAYVENNHIIPLNKLVDLKQLSKILETSNSLYSFMLNLFKKRLKINRRIFPFIGRLFFNLLKSLITKETLNDNFKNIFGIVVNPSQNRYNIDYNFIKTCNLYSNKKDKFISFCENNIFNTGKKELKSLNKEHFIYYQHI